MLNGVLLSIGIRFKDGVKANPEQLIAAAHAGPTSWPPPSRPLDCYHHGNRIASQ